MKKIISLAIVALLMGFASSPNYYVPGQDIVGDGFVYKCKDNISIVIYNSDNPYPEMKNCYRDGSPIHGDPYPGDPMVADGGQIFNDTRAIIQSVLTESEKDSLRAKPKRELLMLNLYFNSTTGRVANIEFSFMVREPGFMSIPPERYRQIELRIKEKISIELTDEGRKRNYVFYPVEYAVK